jgi:hypothetical protein
MRRSLKYRIAEFIRANETGRKVDMATIVLRRTGDYG